MSLNKQMILFITSILLIVLIGTFALNFNQTRNYLESQLESHAQDTATSLGLSLSTVANIEDPASMEAMVNAVFDRGFFANISLLDVDNNLIYQRSSPITVEGIPNWFLSVAALKAPVATALVQSGWFPVGSLKVQSNPRFAYIELWKSSKALAIWFLLTTFLTLTFALYAIRVMLRPLKKMQLQAEAIVRKEYLLQEDLPKTTEFKQVVLAMNTMVQKMKEVFDRDAKVAEKMQKLAYQDSVTGLSNRTHFEMNIEPLLDKDSEALPGLMSMIRVHNLKELNDKYGYLIGDQFMKLLAENMIANIDNTHALSARISGTELALVIQQANTSQLVASLKSMGKSLKHIEKTLNIENIAYISIGLIDYAPGDKRGALFAKLALAVNKASLLGRNKFHYEKNNLQNQSDEVWFKTIQNALINKKFILFQQSSYSQDKSCHSKELLVRLQTEEGQVQTAGYFIPAIKHLNKEVELDNLVLDLAFDFLKSSSSTSFTTIDINLNPSVLSDASFFPKLKNNLKNIKAELLSFEMTEQVVTNNQTLYTPFSKALRSMGIKYGIDNFGSRFANMSYLQKIRPDYIKLDPAFSHVIEKDERTRSYVASLVDMCHSLDIAIIASSVENEAQQQAFHDLGVTLYQGFLYGAPKPLERAKNT